jgi:HEAT repeat protein
MTEYIKEADIQGLMVAHDVEQLIAVLERGGTRAMQMDAATALGKLADEAAVPALINMGNHKWHWIGVRVNSIVSLGKIGGDEARAALVALAEYDDFHAPNEEVEAIQKAAKLAIELLTL